MFIYWWHDGLKTKSTVFRRDTFKAISIVAFQFYLLFSVDKLTLLAIQQSHAIKRSASCTQGRKRLSIMRGDGVSCALNVRDIRLQGFPHIIKASTNPSVEKAACNAYIKF